MPENNEFEKISSAYQIHRSILEHEDNLFGNRLSWLISCNAFLLFPFVYCIFNVSHSEADAKLIASIRLGIPMLAIAISTIASFSGHAALHAVIKTIEEMPLEKFVKTRYVPEYLFPRTGKDIIWLTTGSIPSLLIVFWTVVLFFDERSTYWMSPDATQPGKLNEFSAWPDTLGACKAIAVLAVFFTAGSTFLYIRKGMQVSDDKGKEIDRIKTNDSK